MGQLTITFSGIMTHFYDCLPFDSIVPKIPMRSVIPDALGVNIGFLQRDSIEGADIAPLQIGYYLMPHVPLISDVQTVVPHQSNWIPLLGAHLQVANPAPPFTFTGPPFQDGYHLNEYVPELKISKDVVENGNAAAYFDLFSGVASVLGDKTVATSSLSTQVVIETVGDPRLSITPFADSPLDLGKYRFLDGNQWPLAGGQLYVSNLDFDSGTEDVPIEFLLNYLVAEGGLPKSIARNTPGMGDRLDPLTLQQLGCRLQQLGGKIAGSPAQSPLTRESLALSGISHAVPLDQSCSDSRFP